jgi:hypothetical protein
MQRKQFLRLLAASFGLSSVGSALTACGGGDGDEPFALLAAQGRIRVEDGLSQDEIEGLMFMREEEKLAHDVYVALHERWGAQVFANIAEAETEHTEAIRRLLVAHGLEDPAADTAPGEFVNADLQALYDRLITMGEPSLKDALAVGCLIEEIDIRDIESKKALVVDEPDIIRVYDHLLCGSRNHLRAFNRNMVQQGEIYVPTVLGQANWDAIANSPLEFCGS